MCALLRMLDTRVEREPVPLMNELDAPTPMSGTRTVDFCLPCVKCWYDLRGIGVRERCPECGTPVSRTMRSLFASDLKYLKRLYRRLVWLLVIQVVQLAIGVATIVMVPGYVSFWVGPVAIGNWHWLLLSVPLLIRSSVLLSDVFQAEGREPRVEAIRRAVRPTFVIWMFGYVAAFVLGGVVFASAHRAPGFYEIIEVAACIAALLWVLRNMLLTPHLRRMCRRIGIMASYGLPWLCAMGVAACFLVGVAASHLGIMGIGDCAQFATLLLPLAAGSLISIFGRCCSQIGKLIRFRESGGKLVPRSAG